MAYRLGQAVARRSGGGGEIGSLQRFENARPFNRFCKDDLSARLLGAGEVGLAVAGDDQHARASAGLRDELSNQHITWNVGQAKIAEYHVELAVGAEFERIAAIGGRFDLGTFGAKQKGEYFPDVGGVLYDQDP